QSKSAGSSQLTFLGTDFDRLSLFSLSFFLSSLVLFGFHLLLSSLFFFPSFSFRLCLLFPLSCFPLPSFSPSLSYDYYAIFSQILLGPAPKGEASYSVGL
ncbi:hypothetical protein U1Q18_031778, partial [Sarracenia purpurea var. burkii]